MAEPLVPSPPNLFLLGGDQIHCDQVLHRSVGLWTMAPRGERMEQGVSRSITLFCTCQNLQLQRDFKMGSECKVCSVDGPLISVERRSTRHVRSRREPADYGSSERIPNEIQMGN